MSLIGALKAAKKTAPFYSAVDEALGNLKRPKGTGIEFLTEVLKQPGVKKAEIADRKLEQAFKAKGKMTKEEAQQVLADNPPPKLKEKVYDESAAIDEDDLREMVSQEMFGVPYSTIGFSGARHRQISDEVYRRMEMDNGTQYGAYKAPGGENYREILLKLPETFTKNDFNRLLTLEAEQRRGELTTAQLKELVDLQAKKQTGPSNYISGHWKEDPNVLAHMRVQDRKGPNGEKILHVEEIQSDWHQAGRKKGYATGNEEQDYVDYLSSLELRAKNEAKQDFISEGVAEDKAEVMASRLAKRLAENPIHLADYFGADVKAKQMELNKARVDARSAIPDAPFKKNWHELAMKRLLNYAADNGYDSIALTPGAEQAKRYDLSKQISRVVYSPDTGMLNAFDHNNKSVVMHSNVTPDQVADYIGKEPAQRLFDEQNTKLNFKGGKDVPYQEISGIDLQVGGEGMKGFYDKILPDYLNTFGKPYGAQVQSTTFDVPVPSIDPRTKMSTTYPIHNFPITPEMRESIKQKGLPLYQQVGIPTVGAGAASQMLEPEEEPQYAKGGTVKPQVKKSVSGTVKMTNNRDAMFMELSNNKLKRK